jgi:DNA-binding transcriptional ArsR family regulator
MNPDRVAAVCRRLRDAYGDAFGTAITTGQVEDAVRRILADVGVSGVTEDSTMHYGEEKSRNDFADEIVGYLYGCMDPGDEMILNALAELGQDATPATERDDDGELHRAKGRGFDGPDADTAAALLASVRENHVAQGAGRYARNPDDPDSQATVYVHTDAAPPGFVDYETPGVEWLATETQREIIDTLAARPNATTRELADAVGVSKEHVRNTLTRLAERDLVHRHRGGGEHGADEWESDESTAAFVDVGPLPETANEPLCDSSRWSLAITRRDDDTATTQAGTDAGAPPTTVQIDADPPPDTAD